MSPQNIIRTTWCMNFSNIRSLRSGRDFCSITRGRGGLSSLIKKTPDAGVVPSSPSWCREFRNRKNTMSRLVLNVEEPTEKLKSGKDKWVTADTRPNKSLSDFNLTMGTIMMGKSQQQIAIEGARMVEEAVICGLHLEKLFLLRSLKTLPDGLSHLLKDEKQQASHSGLRLPEIHRVGLKSMETWSSLTTPPGIIGVFRKPHPDNEIYISRETSLPLSIICDNIREPGNLGSILRTASGAGCGDVYLSKGCVDPWNMKVLRGACGAHFRLPVTSNTIEELERLMEKRIMQISETNSCGTENRFSILICDSNLKDARLDLPSTPFGSIDYTQFSYNFLIIGGETESITDTTIRIAKLLNKKSSVNVFRIRIPLANNIESLNVANAFGVIVFEMVRQLGSLNN